MFSASSVSASSAFLCQPGFYQVISGQLNLLNPVAGTYTPIGTAGDAYNAIGYNPRDNFIYGWGTGGAINGQVIRVHSDGTTAMLGNANQTGTSFFTADFDDDGFLWIRKNSTVMVKIDVTTNTATSTEIAFTGAALIGADMGWIGDNLYAVDGANLMVANLNTLVATQATVQDLNSPAGKQFPGTGTFGAVFSNRADELYASHNQTGRIYRITDYNTANPKATWVVDATVTSNNDGAACKLAPSPFDLPTATNDTYSTNNSTALTTTISNGIFANDGASTPTVASNTTPSSGTLAMNSNGTFTYTPAANFVGTVTFTYVGTDQWGRTMPSATVTITVTKPTGQTSQATTAPTTTSQTRSGSGLPATGTNDGLVMLGVLLLLFGICTQMLQRAASNRQG